MRRDMVVAILALYLFSSSLYAQAQAQAPSVQEDPEIAGLRAEIEQLKTDYNRRIQDLETQLQNLQSRITQPGDTTTLQPAVLLTRPSVSDVNTAARKPELQVPSGTGVANSTQGVQGSSISNSKVFNPDISVIGDFLGAAGSNKVDPQPALEMHESEAAFQAVVDPYARADFFLSFGENAVDLEEGYITFPAVKGGLLIKVGKMRAAFGKVNTLHNHVLPWTDRPLVNLNLVGGEDGIDDAGISVARLIPNRLFFLEATGQVYRGDSDQLFHSSKRGDLSYVGHLRGYQDITDSTNIDLGVSFAQGHNASGFEGVDFGQFKTRLWGTDATLRWKPLQRAIYQSFIARSEFVWSRRDQPGGPQKGLGYYVSGDYQFARRWTGGVRYDWTNLPDDATLHDAGQSILLTYRPSEFSEIRGQYRRTRYAIGPLANEFLFQFQFAIGAHGAHPF